MRVYSERDFEEASFDCPKCGWRGKGEDTHVVDFYGISRVMEAHCPGCDKQLGSISRADRNGRSGHNGPDSFHIG
jgi:hypothetical protein